jgi:hypothetical protein
METAKGGGWRGFVMKVPTLFTLDRIRTGVGGYFKIVKCLAE